MSTSCGWEGKGRYSSFRLRRKRRVCRCYPLTMRAIPERLRDASCGGAIQIDHLLPFTRRLVWYIVIKLVSTVEIHCDEDDDGNWLKGVKTGLGPCTRTCRRFLRDSETAQEILLTRFLLGARVRRRHHGMLRYHRCVALIYHTCRHTTNLR